MANSKAPANDVAAEPVPARDYRSELGEDVVREIDRLLENFYDIDMTLHALKSKMEKFCRLKKLEHGDLSRLQTLLTITLPYVKIPTVHEYLRENLKFDVNLREFAFPSLRKD